MIHHTTHRQPPLAGYYNRHEFVPTSPNLTMPVSTLYLSAYHRDAPCHQQAFRHEQPAVWYQTHMKNNTNDIVREYTERAPSGAVATPVTPPLMTEAPYERVTPRNTAPIPVTTPSMTESKHRPILHIPTWSLLMHQHKNTGVTSLPATQQQQQSTMHWPHQHLIHWPHWNQMGQSFSSSSSSSSRDSGFPRHPWSWRHSSHSVGAGAA